MKIENKYVYRCDAISSVDGFLSVREVLKLEMFGDEYEVGLRNLVGMVSDLQDLYPNVSIPEYNDTMNEKEKYDFVDSIISSLIEDCGISKEYFNYAIWACDNPEDVVESYNGVELEEVSKYYLKSAILLQDLDIEGKLYGCSEYPEEIFEENKKGVFMDYSKVFQRIYEDVNSEDIEEPQEKTLLPETEIETGYYQFANGEDEVRKLVNSIRNGNSSEDKAFLALADRDFNDWIISPVAVEIMKFSSMDNDNDMIKCYDKIDSLVTENVIYKRVNEPNENAVVTEWSQIWDDIGDGKNPLDYYIVSHDRSDGLLRTHIYAYNGEDWYYISSIDLEEVKSAFIDYCYETGDYSMISKIAEYLGTGSDIFNNKESIV